MAFGGDQSRLATRDIPSSNIDFSLVPILISHMDKESGTAYIQIWFLVQDLAGANWILHSGVMYIIGTF